MAISQSENIEGTLVITERAWRVEYECPNASDYTIKAHIEEIKTLNGVIISQKPLRVVIRSVAAVMTQPFGESETLSIADGMLLTKQSMDRWNMEDRGGNE